MPKKSVSRKPKSNNRRKPKSTRKSKTTSRKSSPRVRKSIPRKPRSKKIYKMAPEALGDTHKEVLKYLTPKDIINSEYLWDKNTVNKAKIDLFNSKIRNHQDGSLTFIITIQNTQPSEIELCYEALRLIEPPHPLHELIIVQTMTDDRMGILTDALPKFSSLRSLKLTGNRVVTDNQIEILSDALKINTSLSSFDFSYNK